MRKPALAKRKKALKRSQRKRSLRRRKLPSLLFLKAASSNPNLPASD
jgi:hypothetical protein